MVVMFGMVALVMGTFLGYHLVLLRAGMTTNETFKWRDLRNRLQEQAADLTPGCACDSSLT